MTVATLRRCLAVLEVRLDQVPRWRGAALDRLLDEGHARLQAAWKGRLARWGWQVWAEVSFNRYGERGRIDLLAWYPPLRFLVVCEIKTEIADVQDLLGVLDVKARLAPHVGSTLGLPAASLVVPALIVADGSTNRDRIRRLEPLFDGFTTRGRKAASWLHRPAGHATGLLIFSDLRPANAGRVMRISPHRVRPRTLIPSVERGVEPGDRAKGPA